MKTFYLILVAFLVSQISSRTCIDTSLPTKASDCHDATDKNTFYRCCYMYAKVKSGQEAKMCIPVDEATYKEIGKAIDAQKKQYSDQIKKADTDAINKFNQSLISAIEKARKEGKMGNNVALDMFRAQYGKDKTREDLGNWAEKYGFMDVLLGKGGLK